MAVTPHSNNVTATEDVATSQNTAFFEKRFGNTTSNILKDYESVTYRISMGAVSGDSFKNASYLDDTANGKDSRFIVFGESGFTGTSNNKETKGSSNSIGKRVITAKGVPEYFIDNLKFKIMMPGNDFGYSGLSGGSFEVVEPYSLGLFFESLLASSIAAGFKHFNDNCPFILRIDFFGYQDGEQKEIPDAGRVIPIRIQNVTFKANESGSQYTVTFLEFGSSHFASDPVKDLVVTTTFAAGPNLRETIANFQKTLNDREADRVSKKLRKYPDIYEIKIGQGYANTTQPTSQESINRWNGEIKFLSNLDEYEKNKKYFNPVDEDPNAPNARLITNEANQTVFTYTSSPDSQTDLYAVLNDIMCHTEFAKESIEKADKDGYTLWWIINGQLSHQMGTTTTSRDPERPIDYRAQQNETPKYDPIDGRIPMNYQIIILPYLVRLDQLKKPAVKIEDTPKVKKQIKKVYSYLYTGLNDDILSFEMSFNNMFYISGQPQAWSTTAEESLKKILKNKTEAQNTGEDANLSVLSEMAIGNITVGLDKTGTPKIAGGLGTTTTEIEVARWVHSNVTGHTNDNTHQAKVQLTLDLAILGDTYYLPMAGLSNQLTEAKDEMRWKGEETRIYVRFRTINDYPFTGSSLPITNADGLKDHPFSGIYRLMIVENEFTGGVFKQKLELRKDFSIDPDIKADATLVDQQSTATAQDLNPILGADFKQGEVDGVAIIPKSPSLEEGPNQ